MNGRLMLSRYGTLSRLLMASHPSRHIKVIWCVKALTADEGTNHRPMCSSSTHVHIVAVGSPACEESAAELLFENA